MAAAKFSAGDNRNNPDSSGSSDSAALAGVDGVLADLEQQAGGLDLRERGYAVAALAPAEYAAVDLAGRLHASVGRRVCIRLPDGLAVDGRLEDVHADACVLAAAGDGRWVLPLAACLTLDGLSPRSRAEQARPVGARLGMASVLRDLGESRTPVRAHLRGGVVVAGVVSRVGSDFVEVQRQAGATVVPLTALVAVRTGWEAR